MNNMKLGKLTTVGVLLIVAALGVIPVAGATIFNQQEGLLCSSDEIVSAGNGDYFGPWTIEEIARVSEVGVVGELGTGSFVKRTLSGATDKCGTRDDPAILHYLSTFEVEEYVKGSGSSQITLILSAELRNGLPAIRSDVPQLLTGEKYLLLLSSKASYEEERYGPDHYRLWGFPYDSWVVKGDSAMKSRDWAPEQVISIQDLKNRVAKACDSPIQPGHEKVVLKHQHCP